jgi:hypothetical protein
MTSKRTLVTSTASLWPVITSSHARSVSSPDHPALLLMPSGGVRVESEKLLFTTAMWAPVMEAMSSSRRRTSILIVGLPVGVSRISERGTLMLTELWGEAGET